MDAVVLEALAARGVEVGQVYPKPLTDDVVRAADWVITFGPRDAVPVYEHTVHQHWDVADLQDAAPERVRAVVDDLDHRVRALCADLRA